MRRAVLPGPFQFWTRTCAKPIQWQRNCAVIFNATVSISPVNCSYLCTKRKYQRMGPYEVPYLICNTEIPAWGDAPLKPPSAPTVMLWEDISKLLSDDCRERLAVNNGVMLGSWSLVLLSCSYTWEMKGLHGAFSLGACPTSASGPNVCTFKPFWNPWFPHPYPFFSTGCPP